MLLIGGKASRGRAELIAPGLGTGAAAATMTAS
jgi:hypothetical protein